MIDLTATASRAHVREHSSILASAERRALIWTAERLPRAITSDHLSALGFISTALAGVSFASFRWTHLAAFGVAASLFANWFGDSLDGTVARVRRQERPRYGFYVDHVIDVSGAAFLLAGLAGSTLMNPLLALGLLAAFLLVSAESYLAAHALGVFRLSFLGVGPTELRLALIVGAFRAAQSPSVVVGGFEWRLFDVAGAIGIAGLVSAFAASAVRNGRALFRLEPVSPSLWRAEGSNIDA
jgi:archaetidylinositol phosphate synthase